MDHNNFSFKLDIIDPIKSFLAINKISTDKVSHMKDRLTYWEIENYDSVAITPEEYDRELLNDDLNTKKSGWWCTIF